jgi:hypothetical protein
MLQGYHRGEEPVVGDERDGAANRFGELARLQLLRKHQRMPATSRATIRADNPIAAMLFTRIPR